MKNRHLIAAMAIASFMAAGCNTLQEVAETAAQAGDSALKVAEWQVCTAATVGAIMRRYGKSSEEMEAWRRFCYPTTAQGATLVDTPQEALK